MTWPERKPYDDLVHEIAEDVMTKRAAALEEACEKALQTGTSGVRVVTSGMQETVEVTREVPYGTIHHYLNGRRA